MAIYRRSIVWRLASDPVARLWSGIGDIEMLPDEHDSSGAIYKGAGALLQVPELRTLMNGVADRVTFALSGVSSEVLRLALEDRPMVEGAALHIGHVMLDASLQAPDPCVWEWRGIADVLAVESKVTAQGRERTISLSVASADTRRANPQFAWFTDADQRRRSPTDSIFSHVAGITAGTTRRFGAK